MNVEISEYEYKVIRYGLGLVIALMEKGVLKPYDVVVDGSSITIQDLYKLFNKLEESDIVNEEEKGKI